MAGPLRPNPPPLSLIAVERLAKKGSNKSSYFLNGPALYPPPPPYNGPAILRRIFFCGLPNPYYGFKSWELKVNTRYDNNTDVPPGEGGGDFFMYDKMSNWWSYMYIYLGEHICPPENQGGNGA